MKIKIFNDKESGLIWCVTVGLHDKVSFHDCRYEFGDYGQFVAAYQRSTLLERPFTTGLCLQGDVPAWSISAKCMFRIQKWLEDV